MTTPASQGVSSTTGPFAIIPEWLLFSPDLPDRAVRLYAVLQRHDRGHGIYPSRQRLTELLGCSAGSIDRALDELKDIGALVVEPWFDKAGRQTSNRYVLDPTDPSLRRALIAHDQDVGVIHDQPPPDHQRSPKKERGGEEGELEEREDAAVQTNGERPRPPALQAVGEGYGGTVHADVSPRAAEPPGFSERYGTIAAALGGPVSEHDDVQITMMARLHQQADIDGAIQSAWADNPAKRLYPSRIAQFLPKLAPPATAKPPGEVVFYAEAEPVRERDLAAEAEARERMYASPFWQQHLARQQAAEERARKDQARKEARELARKASWE